MTKWKAPTQDLPTACEWLHALFLSMLFKSVLVYSVFINTAEASKTMTTRPLPPSTNSLTQFLMYLIVWATEHIFPSWMKICPFEESFRAKMWTFKISHFKYANFVHSQDHLYLVGDWRVMGTRKCLYIMIEPWIFVSIHPKWHSRTTFSQFENIKTISVLHLQTVYIYIYIVAFMLCHFRWDYSQRIEEKICCAAKWCRQVTWAWNKP